MSRVAEGHFRRKRSAPLTVEGCPRTLSGPSLDPSLITVLCLPRAAHHANGRSPAWKADCLAPSEPPSWAIRCSTVPVVDRCLPGLMARQWPEWGARSGVFDLPLTRSFRAGVDLREPRSEAIRGVSG